MGGVTNLRVLPSPEQVAQRVADWILALSQAQTGEFRICLSGGSTPQLLYQLLAQSPWIEAFPWARVHWFWGDERFVAAEDGASNYRMVKMALLDHAPIPATHIHPIPTHLERPTAAARAYEQELQQVYGAKQLTPDRYLFDVTLLGLGSDGHTASLFPGQAVLTEQEHWVGVSEPGLKPFVPRITLTYPALHSSRDTAFLICGAEKHTMLTALLAGDSPYPAGQIHPQGQLHWFVDTAAYGSDQP